MTMRLLEGALSSVGADSPTEHEAATVHGVSPLAAGLTHSRHSHPSSFIRRCWFPERGCDESSTCSDLRALWENSREDVEKLPPLEQCGRPQYIVTGASRTTRNGVIDDNRLESLIFPGEKWHKCCIMVNPNNKKAPPRFVCEHLKEVPRQKLMYEMKGWCGPHKCINPRNRCLIVDEQVQKGYKPKFKDECPTKCKGQCDRKQQKFECIYTGVEPKYGEEGDETPQRLFNEKEAYDVISLQTSDDGTSGLAEKPGDAEAKVAETDPIKASTEEGPDEASMPLEAAFLAPIAQSDERAKRHRQWNQFLS